LARDASAWRLTAGAVDVFFGTAKFTGPTSIVVDDTPLSFSRAVIAAGTSLIEPKIDGLKTVGYRTLDTLGEMPRLPRRLAVLGDDPQGAAAAQVMRRLGCEVHLITMLPTLLPGEEPEIDEWLARQLAHDGVHLHLTAIVRRIEQTGQSKGLLIERDGAKRKILVDEILVVGRHRPNLDDLAVGAAGIRFNADAIVVSPSMQTANSAVFAAGAACGCGDSALAAEASAGVAVQSALGPRRERFELSNVPRVLLTNPQVARLGLTFREALARGGEVESRRIILTDGESNGLLLLHRDRRTDRLLGATIVASNAAARLAPLVLAAAEGLPLAKAGVLDASAV
jgi:pyruvate/2-oxoglutarate dehydrogenase complex dihydrolipoamide dehydrogenase (E3) component